jgi:S-(hydroxymethyl)glutathione dehydrogenase/alcohol dehydrogenase
VRFSAAIFRGVGSSLSIEEVEVGPLGPSDVLVRIHASGLCHTDREVMQGGVLARTPCILGHEGAGVVEAVGSGVTRVTRGDHVLCGGYGGACGHCYYCRRSQPMFCEQLSSSRQQGTIPNGPPRFMQAGKPIHHFICTSCFCEYTVVPEGGAIPIPREIPFDRACIIGCCVTTGVASVTRVADVEVGASVAVVGCGPVGLNVLQGATLANAGAIIAIDTNPDRLAMALQFGATHTFSPKSCDVVSEVKSLTGGRGVDYAFEAAGNDASIQSSLEITRPGGEVLILGKTPLDHHVPVRFGSIMSEKKIMRSTLGGARQLDDFPMLCRLYLDGKLKLDELISRRISLNDINAGFDELDNSNLIRAVIEMH